ncbi:hypothetical protein SB775_04670 [Peribacillus sp. SIMBA_075]
MVGSKLIFLGDVAERGIPFYYEVNKKLTEKAHSVSIISLTAA